MWRACISSMQARHVSPGPMLLMNPTTPFPSSAVQSEVRAQIWNAVSPASQHMPAQLSSEHARAVRMLRRPSSPTDALVTRIPSSLVMRVMHSAPFSALRKAPVAMKMPWVAPSSDACSANMRSTCSPRSCTRLLS